MIVILAAPIGENSSFGNQLFQLSFGLYLEKNLGVKVRFFIRKKASTRPWSLRVNSEEQVIESLIHPSTLVKTRGFVDSLIRLATFLPGLTLDDSVLADNASGLPIRVGHAFLSNGYAQNYQFAEIVRTELLDRFDKSSHFRAISNVGSAQISVHVRLGDYLSDTKNLKTYGVIGSRYYHDSVNYMIEQTGIRRICVVSDDPSRAYPMIVAALRDIPKLVILQNKGSMRDDFRTLASSRAVIIGNSTFAWWGAWLANARYQSPVVYPSPWYLDPELDSSGLKNPNWTPVFRGTEGQP